MLETVENGDENGYANGTAGHVELQAHVREMEKEGEKPKQMLTVVDQQMNLRNPPTTGAVGLHLSFEEKVEIDNRSIYVGNVDYGATAVELESHFHGCGSIKRVTILCNKFDGHPKGFAYIEFADKDSVQAAMAMDESLFRGRQIKVNPKRTNRPGLSTTNRGFRGRRRSRYTQEAAAAAAAAYYGYRPVRPERVIGDLTTRHYYY